MLPWFENGQFPLYLAPMAGFTDVVFRKICKQHGADVMVTEFVMANRFLDSRGEKEAWETVDFSPEQRPMGVQIFGSDPNKMGEAARRIVDRLMPDFLDINYGCPAQRVVDNCAGSSLLKDPTRLRAVANAIVRSVGNIVPVTAKIRIGWDETSVNAVEISRILEDTGIQAIAVHGRTKAQGYRGDANWDVIRDVAHSVTIPVIGNGSVTTTDDVRLIQEEGSVRGLMIGRAALGYPWIFNEIKTCLQCGEMPPPPDLEERWRVLLNYCHELMSRPVHADSRWNQLAWMRSRLKTFTKIIPGSRKLRASIEKINTFEELEELAHEHLDKYHGNLTEA